MSKALVNDWELLTHIKNLISNPKLTNKYILKSAYWNVSNLLNYNCIYAIVKEVILI